jgi:sugar phosphate isomerase/epimerase
VALHPGDLVLCSGTLARGVPFADRLAAARAGGFSGVSLWGRDHHEARAEGLSDQDLVAMLDDHGLSVAEVDVAWSWLPGASEVHIPPELDGEGIFRFHEADLFAIAETLGARSVNAVDVFGGNWTLDQAAASFATLCRRAAEHGLIVQLEFLPWSRIPNLTTAWQIVRQADQPNGGITLDAWHYFRSSSDDGLLRSIPGDRVLGVQLSDAPAQAEPDLAQAALHDRLLPGAGDLNLGVLVADLRHIQAQAPIGVEVFSDALDQLPALEAARQAGEAARRILSA